MPTISPSNPNASSPVSTRNLAATGITNIPILGEGSPDRQQVEPTIAADPRNPDIIVAGAQDLRLRQTGFHRWHGYYRSIDGGLTWTTSLLPGYPGDTSPAGKASPLHHFDALSDPILAFDRMGNLYYAGIAFNVTIDPSADGHLTAFVAKYVNDGADYSRTTLITGSLDNDKPWIAVDTSGGPNDGNVYIVFDADFSAASPYGTVLSRSTDHGATFSQPFFVPGDGNGVLPGVTVDNGGNVYVSSDLFSAGSLVGSVRVSKLVNGGTSLLQTVTAIRSMTYLNNTLPGARFRNFTIPQITSDQNGVYLVWEDMVQGNANVFLTKSTDGGTSWTHPTMINEPGQGQHFFPSISATEGMITVAWYDSRLNVGNVIMSLDVFYAVSLDDGVSFSRGVRITGQSFDPNSVLRGDSGSEGGSYFDPFVGDYIQIATTSTMAHIIWTDNRSACDTIDPIYGCQDQDVLTASISLPDFQVSGDQASISLRQGQMGRSVFRLESLEGFSGTIEIFAAGSPPGLDIAIPAKILLPANSTLFVPFTISSSLSAQARNYQVNLNLSMSPRSHTLSYLVTVLPFLVLGGPGTPIFLALGFLLASVIIALGVLIYHRSRMSMQERGWPT